jgi:hypothetical protein
MQTQETTFEPTTWLTSWPRSGVVSDDFVRRLFLHEPGASADWCAPVAVHSSQLATAVPKFWGLTGSDGPRWTTQRVHGIERIFFDVPRGALYGPDDGTVAPWAAAASLPFAPHTKDLSHRRVIVI